MTSSENQPEAIYNRPGQRALSYRIARHDDSLKRMLAWLHTQRISPNHNDGSRHLGELTASHKSDPAIAFLDSWATVMEVLTFYQERIANEGFVNTATERLSVLELSRTVGYELDPGVAASTYLAFIIEESDDVPEIVKVPEGVTVESVPIADEEPQVFETVETLEMRGAWNSLPPHLPSEIVPQQISEQTVSLKLSGTETQLAEGDALLILEEQVESFENLYTKLTTVETDDELDYTAVSWEKGLGWEPRSQIQVFAFREQVTLFGNEAPEWNELSPEEQRLYGYDTGGVFNYVDNQEWKSISTGLLKNTDVRALVRESNTGSLFVGTNNGIFRSQDEGKNWVEINKGLTNLDIYSLAVNEKGYIFAGATEGNVFRSIDLGESWVEIGSGGVSVIIQYQVPRVEALQEAADSLDGAANSLDGAADSLDGGIGNAEEIIREAESTTRQAESTTRQAANTLDTLPGNVEDYNAWGVKKTKYIETSLPSSIIRCLAVYENIIYAGTEYGIFRSQDSGRTWEDINKGDGDSIDLSGTIVYSIARIKTATDIFLGTDQGVFRFQDDGNGWEGINDDSTLNESKSVYSLVTVNINDKNYLFAGTNTGVFLCQNASEETAGNVTWEEKNNGEMTDETTVYSLSIASNSDDNYYIYAGTNQGVFRSQVNTNNGDVNWEEINNELINQEIRSTLVYFDEALGEKLLAGSWFDSLYTKEWPGFAIANQHHIDLNGIYDNIFPDSWVVLKHEESNQAYKVKNVATVLRNEFGENGKLTRIELENTGDLSAFGEEKYRETVVLAQSESLKLYEEIIYHTKLPVEGDEIELDKVVPGLEEERKIIINGKQMRAKIPPMGGVVRQSLLSDKTWANLTQLWTPTDVNDLLIDKEGNRETLFAGTARGVSSLELGCSGWLSQTGISVLEFYEQGGKRYILAGTAGGVFRHEENDGTNWSPLNVGLPLTDVRDLVIYKHSSNSITIIAGTREGVFRYDDNGDGSEKLWRQMNSGLKNTDVQALDVYKKASNPRREDSNLSSIFVYEDGIWVLKESSDITNTDVQAIPGGNGEPILGAGTAEGVFIYQDGSWTLIEIETESLNNKQVRDLEIYADSLGDRVIYAGTAAGVFKHNGTSWSKLKNNLINQDVRAVETYVENFVRYIVIGTAKGVFRRSDGSSGWEQLSNGLADKDVYKLESYQVNNDRTFLVGTAQGLFRYEGNSLSDLTEELQHKDIRVIKSYQEATNLIILVGTTRGVLKLEADSSNPLTTDLPEKLSAIETYTDDNNELYLLAGTESGILCRKLDHTINWQQFRQEGLSNTNIKALEIYAEKGDRYLLAGTENGIFNLNLDQANAEWKNITYDLLKTDILALTTYAETGVRTIFVGTTEGDIFSLKSDSQSWIQFDNNVPNKRDVTALATYTLRGDRYLWAGTELGVLRLKLGNNAWEEFNTDLPNKQIKALDIYQDSDDISLLAGTSAGIFGRNLRDLTAGWAKFSDSWDNPNKDVTSVKTYEHNDTRYIFIALAKENIFSRDLGGNSWHKLDDEGLTNTDVRSLKIDTQDNAEKYLLAGTAGGIFRQELNQQKRWNRFDNGLTNTDVNLLEIYEQNSSSYILAGTAENVSRRQLNEPNQTWHDLSRGWINRQVSALKIYTQDDNYYVLAGTSDGVFYLKLIDSDDNEESWNSLNNNGTENSLPNKDVRTLTLDIDEQEGRHYILVGTKSGVFRGLLKDANSDLEILSWEPENRALTNNNVYSLALHPQDNETLLFAGTKGGNIYRRNLSQPDSEWRQMRQALANDVRAIAISSQSRVFIGTRNHCILKGTESIESKVILPEESLSILKRQELTEDNTLTAMPSHQVVTPGSLVRWALIDQLGFKGEITTQPGEILLEAAAEADKTVSEVASLKQITHGQQRTTIKIETPLANTYDRTTVAINANVALVTHGETVSDEVIGSGDGSKSNQEFFLKNPPLTYVSAETASGSKSTLSVRVDGLLWEEVTSLEQLTSPEQRYMTRIDDDGKTRIIFGNGYKGARPTTGEENITSTYRTGIGPDGEVAANTITLVQSAPLGVVEVTNPQGATGASAPETREEARQNAPRKTLSLDRIISLRDYEYFIGGFSGIGKVLATQLLTRQGYGMVQVTIAGRNGALVAPDSNLYAQIKKAVEEARDPTISSGGGSASQFSLDNYQRLLFNIKAKLWINWQYVADTVVRDVKTGLREAFAFEKRALAQDVTAAEILQLIQSIPGVDGVDMDALYLDGYDQQLNQSLEAKPASWNGIEVEAAQLLLLNPASGSIDLGQRD